MISRLEAIEIAEFQKEVFSEESNVVQMVNRAISDMQKLEKIEKISRDTCNDIASCDECIYRQFEDCRDVFVRIEIAEILKGEE